jgi:hypothetical protein
LPARPYSSSAKRTLYVLAVMGQFERSHGMGSLPPCRIPSVAAAKSERSAAKSERPSTNSERSSRHGDRSSRCRERTPR